MGNDHAVAKGLGEDEADDKAQDMVPGDKGYGLFLDPVPGKSIGHGQEVFENGVLFGDSLVVMDIATGSPGGPAGAKGDMTRPILPLGSGQIGLALAVTGIVVPDLAVLPVGHDLVTMNKGIGGGPLPLLVGDQGNNPCFCCQRIRQGITGSGIDQDGGMARGHGGPKADAKRGIVFQLDTQPAPASRIIRLQASFLLIYGRPQGALRQECGHPLGGLVDQTQILFVGNLLYPLSGMEFKGSALAQSFHQAEEPLIAGHILQ